MQVNRERLVRGEPKGKSVRIPRPRLRGGEGARQKEALGAAGASSQRLKAEVAPVSW